MTLFKHEMRATAKTFMWFYIAFAAIAVVNAFISPFAGGISPALAQSGGAIQTIAGGGDFAPNAIKGVFMALYIASIFVIALVTVVIIILRFYRNLLGDEGYLMMTLPVTREQHILSKMFAAVIWSVCTFVLVILSLLLLLHNSGALAAITNGSNDLLANGTPLDRWITQIVIILIVSTFTSTLMFYAAMSIGPNLLKNRIGGSILAFIIIYIASQVVMSVILWGMSSAIIGAPPSGPRGPNVLGNLMPINMIGAVDTFFWGTLVGTAAIGVVCWFLTRYMLKRKLNLA